MADGNRELALMRVQKKINKVFTVLTSGYRVKRGSPSKIALEHGVLQKKADKHIVKLWKYIERFAGTVGAWDEHEDDVIELYEQFHQSVHDVKRNDNVFGEAEYDLINALMHNCTRLLGRLEQLLLMIE